MSDEDIDRNIMKTIQELSNNMRDMCVALALAHDVKPSHMLAAMTMNITLMTIEYSKPGQEDEAIENLILGIRSLTADMADMDEYAAQMEAEAAKANGSIQ